MFLIEIRIFHIINFIQEQIKNIDFFYLRGGFNFNNISKYGESFYGEYGENPKYTIKAVSDIGNVKIEYR